MCNEASSVFLFAIIGTTFSLASAAAGQATAAAQADYPMTLDVVVTDKAERPVAGLALGDFKVLLDNKSQRDIASVKMVSGEDANADPPVEAILLVDMINVPFETLSNERKDLIKYLQQMGTRLSVPTRFVFLTATELRFQGEATRDPKICCRTLRTIQACSDLRSLRAVTSIMRRCERNRCRH